MERIEEIVTGYCKRVGAKPPAPRDDGVYVLQFEHAVEVQLSRSEGRDQVLLRADLPQLKRDRERKDTLVRLLRINLLLAARKRSTLTLDETADTPFLYDVLTVGAGEVAASLALITGFVNEVIAFHRALERSH